MHDSRIDGNAASEARWSDCLEAWRTSRWSSRLELEAEGGAAFYLSGTNAKNKIVLLVFLPVYLYVFDLFQIFTRLV